MRLELDNVIRLFSSQAIIEFINIKHKSKLPNNTIGNKNQRNTDKKVD